MLQQPTAGATPAVPWETIGIIRTKELWRRQRVYPQMIARISALFDHLRASLWPLPLAILGVCLGLGVAALNWEGPIPKWLYHGSAGDAAGFASSLVSAMMTVTALSVSITMVVLTLAAQQLGPRLITLFMRAWFTQTAVGLFVGTSAYLVIVLRSLGGQDDFSANLAISVGTALTLLSLVVLVVFAHSLARSIIADDVIAKVGEAFDRTICGAFGRDSQPVGEGAPSGEKWSPVLLAGAGYVHKLDYRRLAAAAASHGVFIKLMFRSGDHLTLGQTCLYSTGAADGIKSRCDSAVVFARERTDGQDPEWPARQLVEVALRALSPGINDEFTAMAVIDRLTRGLALLRDRADPPGVWRDKAGVARVFGPSPSFESLLATSVRQLTDAARSHATVRDRLENGLTVLKDAIFRDEPARATMIQRHLTALREETTSADNLTPATQVGP